MFDWNDLKHFLVVARAGGTVRGAAVLNLSQPAVVRGMTALEQDLGLSLFDRSDDAYKLTEAGRDLLTAAGVVEEGVAAFKAQVDQRSKHLSGTIRVTTNETFANLLLMPSLAEFGRLHPDVRIDVLVEDRLMDLVKGEADVALRGAYQAGKGGGLVARRLHDLPWSVYCSRDYAQRHGGTAPAMADLAQHAAIGGVGGVAAMPGPRWLEEKAGKVATRSNSLTSMLAATRSGMGLGALPCVVGDPEDDLMVCFHLPKTFTATLWLVSRAELRNSPMVTTFGAYMVKRAHTLRALFDPRAPGS
jgi:DNA-binding transcriptional LysR family regulator